MLVCKLLILVSYHFEWELSGEDCKHSTVVYELTMLRTLCSNKFHECVAAPKDATFKKLPPTVRIMAAN